MDISSQEITVFLVGPRHAERNRLAQVFRKNGMQVTASDGSMALPQEESAPPSIILVSAETPGFDFIAFVRQVRSQSATACTPILVLANDPEEPRLIDAFKEGADDIAFKPFIAERLVPRMHAHICLADSRQQDRGYVSQAHEQLRLSERRYRTLASATATIVWIATEDGRILEPLPKWEEFTGQSPGEYGDHGWLAVVHPDDQELVRQFWRATGGERPPPVDVEFRLRHRDGGYRQMRVTAVPLQGQKPGLREWVGAMTDITAKRDAEEALRVSEERLRLILDSSKDFAIFTINLTGEVTMWNAGAERLLGYSGEEIVGTDFHRIFTLEDIAGGAAYVSKEEAFTKLCDTIHAEVDKRNAKRQAAS
jgi:PAS domain S-box-containing protein